MDDGSGLVKVEYRRPCVLASGGPMMDVECVEGDYAVCRWWNDRDTYLRGKFHLATLRSCVQFIRLPEDLA